MSDQERCLRCMCNCHSPRKQYTAEDFIKSFKVGDWLRGWSTGKVVKITAIGETRFLFRDRRGERVAKFYTTNWERVEKLEEQVLG